MLVEGEVSNELLEASVLLLELLQSLELRDAHTGELAPPAVKALLADPHLPAELGDGLAGLGLTQGVADLLVGKSASSSWSLGFVEDLNVANL